MIRKVWSWVYPALIAVFVLGLIALLAVKATSNGQKIDAQSAENHAQDKQITSLVQSLADANKKLSNAGLPTVPVVVQPSNGANGRDGEDGRSVLSVTCGADSVWTVAYSDGTVSTAGGGCIGTPGIQGVAGPAGQDGTNGADGVPGADSTVPGPTGATGAAGADGQPPTSWIFTDHNVEYTCTRDDPFDPALPAYTCAPTPAATTGGDTQ